MPVKKGAAKTKRPSKEKYNKGDTSTNVPPYMEGIEPADLSHLSPLWREFYRQVKEQIKPAKI